MKSSRSLAKSSLGAVSITLLLILCMQAPSYGDEPRPPGENLVDSTGHRIWIGEASEALILVADQVAEFAGSHRDVFAGTAMTSDSTMVEIYATDAAAPALATIEREVGAPFDQLVRIVPVERSLNELLEAQRRVLDADIPSGQILSVGTDLSRNTLDLGLSDAAFDLARSVLALAGIDARTATLDGEDLGRVYPALSGLGTPTTFAVEAPSQADGTRKNDSAPHYFGSQIVGQRTCSLGVPIKIGSVRYALTAGHCLVGSFYNSGTSRFMGSTYTTSWSGNADIYGDWQLLRNSTYSLYLYSGSLSSSNTLRIVGGQFSARSNGLELCSSGRTTGSVCRYRILDSYRTSDVTSGGITAEVGFLYKLISDPNRDGVGSCTGWQSGDSGGPLYYASGTGVKVTSIVTSHSTSGNCTYWSTMLAGVRQWNSSATVA